MEKNEFICMIRRKSWAILGNRQMQRYLAARIESILYLNSCSFHQFKGQLYFSLLLSLNGIAGSILLFFPSLKSVPRPKTSPSYCCWRKSLFDSVDHHPHRRGQWLLSPLVLRNHWRCCRWYPRRNYYYSFSWKVKRKEWATEYMELCGMCMWYMWICGRWT